MIEKPELIPANLKAQFDRLQLVFNKVSEGVIVINAEGVIIDINPAVITMYGFEDANSAIKALSEAAAPIESYIDGNAVATQDLPLNRIRRGEQFYNVELIVRRVDTGYTFFANYNGTCVYDDHHKMIMAVLTVRNITQQKQFEKALQNSEHQFRLVTEAAHIGIWQWDINGHIILDHQAKVIIGLQPDDQLTMPQLMQIIHPDDRQRVEAARSKAVEEHTDYDIEYRIVWPDQGIHWIHSRGHAYYDPDGRPVKMYGVISNITERKQGEQYLRESEEKFRILAENANAIIGIIQGKNFVYVNPYLEEVSGYTSEELLKIDVAIMLHPDYRQMVLERAVKRQLGQEVESKYQFIMITKSGRLRWMDFCAARIMYRGRPAIVGIALDITEAKQFEEQLTILKNDLENKNRELESIIGIVSHDLRSPLVNIKGFIEELKKDCSTIADILSNESLSENTQHKLDSVLHQNIPESLGFIETSASSMSRLVESLVQVARVGIAVLKPEMLDMDALMKEVVAGFEFKIKDKNIEMTFEPLPPAFADKTQTAQIISNLVDNAIKYLDPNRRGSIHISGYIKDDQSTYCIEDNGIGIPKDKQHKLFEIFSRLETKLAAGEGIGLAMIKRMAIRNNGQICLESEPDKGSKFYLALPKQP